MHKTPTRLAAILIAALFIITALPAFAVSAADYDQHDVAKLREFFLIISDSSYPNGSAINGSDFDIDDPSTWTSCTWNSSGKLTQISFSDLGWAVSGKLDLSGCTALKTVVATDCFISAVDFTGCTALSVVNLTGDLLTSIDVSTNTALRTLWFKENEVTSIDLSANTLLTSFDCSNNPISELDLSHNLSLATLRCSNCSLTALDVSKCPLISELNCKTNFITELDVSNLTKLSTFICFNNRIRTLDISVLNGGASFVLAAEGNGYVGTKCYFNADGMTLYASAKAADGESFYGWFSESDPISTDADIPCTLDGSAAVLTAHFSGVLKPGDVNGDGTINSADALLILRYTIGAITSDALHLEAGDVTGDGLVNSSDALMILRLALGIIPSL